MALTVPDTDALLLHMRQEEAFSSIEEEWAEDSLQRATDLAQIATGLEETPEDELAARVLEQGILAMAHSIYVTSGPDREALYSPFSSERLGSYSYTIQDAASKGMETGIPEWDAMIRYFAGLLDTETGESKLFSAESEYVFKGPYGTQYGPDATYPDPTRSVTLHEGAWSE